VTGGSQPAEKINADMVKAMAEKGIDLAFRVPQSIDAALAWGQPEVIVTMGCGEQRPAVPGAQLLEWDLLDPAGQPAEIIRGLRDEIESRVKLLIHTLCE